MPRKFIKKYMPNEQSLRNTPSLRWLSKYLQHPSLWHLNRKSVSKAFLVGIFCAFLPIPMQMLAAAIFAIFIRSNLAVSVSLVWITNPITIPPIFYFTYKVGTFLLNSQPLENEVSFSYEYLMSELTAIWWPLISGSLFCATVFSITAYFSINAFWVWHVRSSWKKRRADKKNQ
ncbi:MAG: hypothetical protein ACI9ES_001443 [Oceanospirillaceae bacterium]|jgi:uncharacterized protein (DUF2062 family)